MTLSFPLTTNQFVDLLPIRSITFRPGAPDTSSQTAGGDLIKHRRGPRLWEGEITLGRVRHAEIAQIEALISAMEEPAASFMIYDTRKPAPSYDPTGATMCGANPVISSLHTPMRELALSALPAGYVISAGDYISFAYGASPVRYALHRVVTGAVASGSGATGAIEVTPFIRPGTVVGTPVTLVRATCKAKLVTADYGHGRAVIAEGASFRWQQTLR